MQKTICKQYKILHFFEHDAEEYYTIQLACNILADSQQLQLLLQQAKAHKNFGGTFGGAIMILYQ